MEKHRLFYPLKVRGGKEKKIKAAIEEEIEKANLQDFLIDVHLMPYDKVVVKKKGKKEFKERFLSYLYIEGECTNARLREAIIQVEGVLGWVGIEGWGASQEPYPIQAKELDKMFNRVAEKQTASTTQKKLKQGDKITIKDPESSFAGYAGEVLEVSKDDKTLQISLNLFGGQHQATVTLTPDQVELASNQE